MASQRLTIVRVFIESGSDSEHELRHTELGKKQARRGGGGMKRHGGRPLYDSLDGYPQGLCNSPTDLLRGAILQ